MILAIFTTLATGEGLWGQGQVPEIVATATNDNDGSTITLQFRAEVGAPLNYTPSEITRVTTENFPGSTASPVNSCPAVAGGRLLIRSDQIASCFASWKADLTKPPSKI